MALASAGAFTPPTGKGHPFLVIESPTGGQPCRYPIACTPNGHGNNARKIAKLRRQLRALGFIDLGTG